MMDRREKRSTFSIYLVTRAGEHLSLGNGGEGAISVDREAAEFFYDVTHALASVKCRNCRASNIVRLEERTCLTEEWGIAEYEDCVVYGSRFECPECGSDLSAKILATWYNNKVMLSSYKTVNCDLVRNHGSAGLKRNRISAL